MIFWKHRYPRLSVGPTRTELGPTWQAISGNYARKEVVKDKEWHWTAATAQKGAHIAAVIDITLVVCVEISRAR